MTDMDDWTALQFQDELQRMRAAVDAWEAAKKAGTPPEALDILAYEAGILQHIKKHSN